MVTKGQKCSYTNWLLNYLDFRLRSLAGQARHALDVKVIADANHFYSGQREELARLVAEWLRGDH